MAKKTETVVTLTDDMDGSNADRTVPFAFDGTNYEIELSKKNIKAFERVLSPYVNAARHAPARRRSRRAQAVNTARHGRSDLAAIREWARAQGIEVSDRGRIAQTVQDAYDAAH